MALSLWRPKDEWTCAQMTRTETGSSCGVLARWDEEVDAREASSRAQAKVHRAQLLA